MLAAAIDNHPANVHTVQPAVVSLTQATELGTAYRPDEIAAISKLAHDRGLDGADGWRALRQRAWRSSTAIPAMSPGARAWMCCPSARPRTARSPPRPSCSLIPSCVRDFEFRRKRAGHLLSKSRFVAAQLLAYVETGVWQRNARRANAFAQRIGRAAGSHC